MLRKLFVLAAAALLVSCVSDQAPVVTVPPGANNVAVVTSLPHEFRLGTTGFTVFENNLDLVDMRDWQLNEVAFDAVRAALPGYQVVHAGTDADIYDPPRDLILKTPDIGDLVRQHAHTDQPTDLYVVICSSPRSYPDSEEKIILQDVGFSKLRSPIGVMAPVVHTYLWLAIVDGHTYRVLASTPLKMNPGRPLGRETLLYKAGGGGYPVQPLDGFDWKNRWRDLTAEQKELVHTQVKSLLQQSISYTLGQTRLARQPAP